jgi:hypothetical protein
VQLEAMVNLGIGDGGRSSGQRTTINDGRVVAVGYGPLEKH